MRTFGGGMPSIRGTDKHALEARLSRFGWILMRRYVDERKVHRLGAERERGHCGNRNDNYFSISGNLGVKTLLRRLQRRRISRDYISSYDFVHHFSCLFLLYIRQLSIR